jgi:hypothetical protein
MTLREMAQNARIDKVNEACLGVLRNLRSRAKDKGGAFPGVPGF